MRFEQHEDEDQFGFTPSAGTAYRLSVHLHRQAAASASINQVLSVSGIFVNPNSPVVRGGWVDYVFTPASNDLLLIKVEGSSWNADSQGRVRCGSGSAAQGQPPIYCYWASDYTILIEEVASAAESNSSATDVCWTYETYPDSFRTPCSMDIDDDVMGYINSQGDRDLWALVQFEANSGYTVKAHGDVDSSNLLDNITIVLYDQWGNPRERGSTDTSSSPASLSIGASRTYTGVYYLEVKSSGDVGAYRIEVID